MSKRELGLLLVLCLAIWINSVDATIVNVALPAIGRSLQATDSQLQWVLDAFNVAVAGCVLLGSGLADRYGRRKMLLTGLVVLTLASIATLWVTNPTQLIAIRGAMGLSVALIMPATLSIIAVEYSGQRRRLAIGIWAGVAGLGLALGPVLGGILLTSFSWASVFMVNVPVALVAIVGVIVLAPESFKPGAPNLDYLGGALSIVGLGGVVFAVIEAPARGWTDPVVACALLLGACSLAAFIWWELRTSNPMFEIRVMRAPAVYVGAVAMALNYFSVYAILFILPQHFEFVSGMSVLAVGFAMLPLGAVYAACSPFVPRLSERIGDRRCLVAGLLLMAGGIGVIAGGGASAPYAVFLVGMVIYSLGWALVIPPATAVVMESVPSDLAGSGSSVNQVSRQVGGAAGVAIVGSIVAVSYDRSIAAISGIPQDISQQAQRSLSEAISISSQIPDGQDFAHQAVLAFSLSGQIAMGVTCAITLAGAFLAWRKLPRKSA